MSFGFHYQFHPVGQGLFCSGLLYEPNRTDPRFAWVFDCGTLSSQGLVRREINLLATATRNRRVIDLVVMSHFDSDHISGMAELLGEFQVDTLLIPYLRLWERMVIALQEGLDSADERWNFFIDPINYVRSIEGANVERIVWVDSSPEEGPEPMLEEPIEPLEPSDEWKMHVPSKTSKGMRLNTETQGITGIDSKAEEVFIAGESILVNGLWEFVPYNDRRYQPRTKNFESEVMDVVDLLLQKEDRESRIAAIQELKKSYDGAFGSSSANRNRISLTLYGGPIYPTWKKCKLIDPGRMGNWPYPERYPAWHRECVSAPGLSPECSVVYTGDSFLDSASKRQVLQSYLGDARWNKIGAFQVNHHGSRKNWYSGLAADVAPVFSVFSSDPRRRSTRHPHPPVWNDYSPFGPVQVNTTNDFSLCGWMLPRNQLGQQV